VCYLSWTVAGYGGLSLSVEGPSKADITCKDKPDGTCGVTYKPTQPGTYVIAIKFADEHVPGESAVSMSLSYSWGRAADVFVAAFDVQRNILIQYKLISEHCRAHGIVVETGQGCDFHFKH